MIQTFPDRNVFVPLPLLLYETTPSTEPVQDQYRTPPPSRTQQKRHLKTISALAVDNITLSFPKQPQIKANSLWNYRNGSLGWKCGYRHAFSSISSSSLNNRHQSTSSHGDQSKHTSASSALICLRHIFIFRKQRRPHLLMTKHKSVNAPALIKRDFILRHAS